MAGVVIARSTVEAHITRADNEGDGCGSARWGADCESSESEPAFRQDDVLLIHDRLFSCGSFVSRIAPRNSGLLNGSNK